MINLYYDKIIEGKPAPNGSKHIEVTANIYKMPVVKPSHIEKTSIMPYNEFYFAMKACKTNVNLYTGSCYTKNLFYPLELKSAYFVEKYGIKDLLSVKVINKIRKGKFKLLLICNNIDNIDYAMDHFKNKLQELLELGISEKDIFIVVSDINKSYSKDLKMSNVFSIDWWQIYSQLVFKERYKKEKLSHFFPYDNNIRGLHPDDIEKEIFNIELWNPTKLFTALTSRQKVWDISLIVELIYNKLENYGDWFFDKSKLNLDYRLLDIIIDNKLGLFERLTKQKILESLKTKSVFKNTNDFLTIDSSIYYTSLFNIVSEKTCPFKTGTQTRSLNVLSPSISVWRQIAQGHPFIVLGDLGVMHYLNKEGYFTYNQLIPQTSFDHAVTVPKKVQNICYHLNLLSKKSQEEINAIQKDIIPYIEKNKKIFFDKDHSRKFWNLFLDMRYESVV